MGVFVKICGLCRREDVAAVAALRPDAVGFVFWSRSPRAARASDVAEWRSLIPDDVQTVGVFVDEDPDVVIRTVEEANLDIAQLHGRETAAVCEDVRAHVWKAVHLDRLPDEPLSAYPVDAFLADSYSTTSPGGTGIVVDWQSAGRFVDATPVPVLLAGGLNPNNVAEAIRLARPWGVDVSSGVEARPGEKDITLVRRFIEQCRIS